MVPRPPIHRLSTFYESRPMHYKKTGMGQTAFQSRSISLSPRQRSAFILFDGKRSVDAVLLATISLGGGDGRRGTVDCDGHARTGRGPCTCSPPHGPGSASKLFSATVPAALPNIEPSAPDRLHYSRAYPVATRLTAGLGLRGLRLNLAVEAAGDLRKLQRLAPKIKEAVGSEKFRELERALYG